jgi:CheY-like chemotaxis protein
MQTVRNERYREPQNEARSPRIILADDDGDLRALIARGLRRAGYEIVELSSGTALVRHLAATILDPKRVWTPDAIVLDVGMPGFSGIEVLADLQRRGWSIPIVVISARTAPAVAANAYRFGAKAFLQKPFQTEHLRALLQKLTGVSL